MPIPVTCPDCQAHFHVGDEFAGVAGRCPECSAVIQVPDPLADSTPTPPPAADAHLDPHPYAIPRGVEAFEELPSAARRARDRDAAHADRADERDVYDDRPARRSGSPRLTFDPATRAARWEGVSRGLRNLLVAVVLITVNLMVIGAFVLVDEIKPAPADNFVGRKIALSLGTTVAAGIGMLLWMVGRFGCARVPYVPARQAAMPAAVVAGLTGVAGVLCLAMMAGGILMAQQGNLGGIGFVGLGFCGLMPVTVGFGIAELMGLASQIRMADGLRDATFGRTSRVLFGAALVYTVLSVCGGCGSFMLFAAAADRAQQQKQLKQQQQKPRPIEAKPADPVEKKEAPAAPAGRGEPGPPPRVVEPAPAENAKRPPAAPNDPGVAPAGNGGAANPPPAQRPPAGPDPAAAQAILYGMTVLGVLLTLLYAGFCVVCFQSGRRAIRREVARLVGDPHDEHH